MHGRIALACLALTLAVGTARAQVPYGTQVIPSRRSLARVGLDLQFTSVVPLQGSEKLIQVSIDDGMMFAQTNHANFYAFDAESGRYLWGAHLGDVTPKAQPASVNAFGVFVSNSNELFGLDRRTGRQMWKKELTDQPASSTAADADRVMLGLESGKLVTYDARTGVEKWNIQTNARVSSRPVMAGRVVAFGSEDRKLYLSNINQPTLYWRFATGGPIVAPLATHGVRTLLVPSSDSSLYAVDLFTGVGQWTLATGSPVKQEPLVSDNDVYAVNSEGTLIAADVATGQTRWSISTLGGRLLSVSATKIYLESHDDDLFVVDRATGKILYDPTTTFQRCGINLRDYELGPTNRFDDRLYFGTSHGLIVCLREIAQLKPRLIVAKDAKPFGYIPPEGYPEAVTGAPPITTTPPAEAADPK